MWRNVSSLSLSNNCGSVEMWKSENVSGMIWQLKIGLARGEMTCVTFIAVNRKTYFCCLFGRKMDGVVVQNLTVADLAFKKYDWRPSKQEDVLLKGF